MSPRVAELFSALFTQILHILSPLAGQRSPNGCVEAASAVVDLCELVPSVSEMVGDCVLHWFAFMMELIASDQVPDCVSKMEGVFVLFDVCYYRKNLFGSAEKSACSGNHFIFLLIW